jgi:hypothetical protein
MLCGKRKASPTAGTCSPTRVLKTAVLPAPLSPERHFTLKLLLACLLLFISNLYVIHLVGEVPNSPKHSPRLTEKETLQYAPVVPKFLLMPSTSSPSSAGALVPTGNVVGIDQLNFKQFITTLFSDVK